MALIVLPYVFTNGTTADATQVNADLNTLAGAVNSGIAQTLSAQGSAVLPGGLIIKWGSISIVADGGTVSPVAFGAAFTNNIFQVVASVSNDFQTNPWVVVLTTVSETTTGFSFNAAGAPSGQSITARWIATGN